MQNKALNKIPIIAFQLCIIANSVFGIDSSTYKISKIVMLMFFAVMAVSILFDGRSLRIGDQMIYPILFAVYCVISLLWSYNMSVAYRQLITQAQLILLLIFTYMAVMKNVEIKDYLDAVYIAGWGMVAFAITRYGGLDNYLAVMEEGARMGSEITNENLFGLVFSNAALAAVYYLIFHKRKVDIVSIAVFTFFALSSGSKKAALLIVLGVLGIVAVKNGIKKIYKTVIVGAIILIAATYVLQLPYFETINTRLEEYFSGELNDSDENRQQLIAAGIRLFKKRPFFGYGLDNFRVAAVTSVYSHNNFIEVLVSGGVVGFALYYAMYVVPICKIFFGKLRKFAWQNKEYLMLFILVAMQLAFSYGMVQLYNKNTYILLGVALASANKLGYIHQRETLGNLQENR